MINEEKRTKIKVNVIGEDLDMPSEQTMRLAITQWQAISRGNSISLSPESPKLYPPHGFDGFGV